MLFVSTRTALNKVKIYCYYRKKCTGTKTLRCEYPRVYYRFSLWDNLSPKCNENKAKCNTTSIKQIYKTNMHSFSGTLKHSPDTISLYSSQKHSHTHFILASQMHIICMSYQNKSVLFFLLNKFM